MPMLRGEMLRSYRVSRGNAGYAVVFSLIWFGAIVGFLIIPWLHTNGWTLGIVAASLVALLIALFPALITASSPYSISLIDDEQCEFRGLLRQRRLRVQQVRAIEWD
jgi:apolipoprotein N-acyltransferase